MSSQVMASVPEKYPSDPVQNSLVEIAWREMPTVAENQNTVGVTWGTKLQCDSTKCDGFLQICYGSMFIVPGNYGVCEVME